MGRDTDNGIVSDGTSNLTYAADSAETPLGEQNCHSMFVVGINGTLLMISTSSPAKPNRNRVDFSNDVLARQWSKRFGKSKAEIEAAIAKVGDNPTTVMKELQVKCE